MSKIYEATLCLLVKDRHVLLARKTRKIGQGRWNGYGGNIDGDEDELQAAIRELGEESTLVAQPGDLEKVAVVDFHNHDADGNEFIFRVHVYLVRSWTGEPQPSEEMADPTWFAFERLPVAEMMPADRIWLPLVLAGRKIICQAAYGPGQQELIGEVRIEEMSSFH